MPTSRRRWLAAAGTALVLVIADQITKNWALGTLGDGHTIDLVGSLRFRLTFNTGTAFSLGSGFGPVLGLGAALVSVALLRFARSVPGRVNLLAIGLVVGGAVGNLVDRAVRSGDGFLGGAVVDFIDLQWWPVFNVADMGIVIGALLLIFGTWRMAESEGEPPNAKAAVQ